MEIPPFFLDYNNIIYPLLAWILIAQYRTHACLKKLEGYVKAKHDHD